MDGLLTLNSDANGVLTTFITPEIVNNVLEQLGAAAAGVSTMKPAFTDVMAATFGTYVTANVQRYRCVTFGVVITPILSASNSSGYVVLQELTQSIVVSSPWSIPSAMGPTSLTFSLKDGAHSWVSRPSDPSNDFIVPKSTTDASATEWSGLKIQIGGAPASTSCCLVRIVGNFECEFAIDNVAGTSARPTVANDALRQAANRVRETMLPYVRGGQAEVESVIARTAGTVLRTAGNAALNYLTGGMSGLRILDN